MKKYVISGMALLLVLGLVYSLSAQPAGGGMGGMGAGARGARGGNTQAQQTAIAELEAQIAKLKENVEAQAAMPRMGRGGAGAAGETPSEEEMQKMMEQRTKLREEQQTVIAAIDDQVNILKGNQLQTELNEEVAELQVIADSATKENATATAKLVQDLIAKRTADLQSLADRLGIRLRRGRGQRQGGGFGGRGAGGLEGTPAPGGAGGGN